MSNVLSQQACLKLNRIGRAMRFENVEKTLGDFFGWYADPRGRLILDKNHRPQRKMLAYNIDFEQLPDGTYLYDIDHIVGSPELVDWDTWVNLPVRPFDLYVDTAKKKIRVPRVVKCLFTDEVPEKKWKNTLDAVYELYNGICQYTKRKISKSQASRDHIVPRSRGGKDKLSNIVLATKEINHRKGNKLNREAGLPDVTPIVPKDIPMDKYLKNYAGVPEWELFLGK